MESWPSDIRTFAKNDKRITHGFRGHVPVQMTGKTALRKQNLVSGRVKSQGIDTNVGRCLPAPLPLPAEILERCADRRAAKRRPRGEGTAAAWTMLPINRKSRGGLRQRTGKAARLSVGRAAP